MLDENVTDDPNVSGDKNIFVAVTVWVEARTISPDPDVVHVGAEPAWDVNTCPAVPWPFPKTTLDEITTDPANVDEDL